MLNTVTRQADDGIASGVTTVIKVDPNATGWSIKINKDGATSGTLALTGKSPGASTAETVYDQYGVAISFDCATGTSQTYRFADQPMDEVIITPTTLNGTYKYSFSQW